MEKVKYWVAVDDDGNIGSGSSTDPEMKIIAPGEELPDFNYVFNLTWDEINELWKFKVFNGELIEKEEGE